jgi:23S rRNA pseudouridine1911/1915/1917 synthase
VDYESEKSTLFSINDRDRDQRIDTYLAENVKALTRSRIQGLIKGGFVKVNDSPTKTSYRLKTGDSVCLIIPPSTPLYLEPEPVKFSLIHEDPSIIVLNKPPGLVIHPSPGHSVGTLVHGLLQHCKDLSGIGGVLRPGIVHRLDKDTSGLIVIAKNDEAHDFLSKQFKNRTIKKRYFALVHGILNTERGEIDLPIGRHPKRRKEMTVLKSNGKRALTSWIKTEEIAENFSLLTLSLKTGRTHQIRVHLSHIGFPIVGDPVYGVKKSWWKKNFPLGMNIVPEINRQMLHAEKLGFIHPDSGKYNEFIAPIPDDMDYIINCLKSIHFQSKRYKKT